MPRGRILAVDDQRYFRELVEGLLVEEGFEVQTCASAEEALRLLDHSVFDVIITDLVMPVMTGTDLVQRIKERDPDQEIIVVTGVVDVKSAVDAMKIGATDYLLKPFDRATLTSAIDSILQRTRLRQERDSLLAENIEFLGERSLFARALGLFNALSLEALSERVLDALCRETGAQGGVLWTLSEGEPPEYRLSAVHGLVRPEEERSRLTEIDVPEALRSAGATTVLVDWIDPGGLPRPSLVIALRRMGGLVGVIRLTDKLRGDHFDDVDRASVEKFVPFVDSAYRNAERFRQLERRTLQDPDTGSYRIEFFRTAVRNEIEKASRFGRRFGLVKAVVGPLGPLRERLADAAFRAWHAGLARHLSRQLRATDLLAIEVDGQFCMLLAESDAIGTATFKERTREALSCGDPLLSLPAEIRPEVLLGCVSHPGDGAQPDVLLRKLDRRVAEDRRVRERERHLNALTIGAALAKLADGAHGESIESVSSLLRFAISEVGVRPRERSVLFCRPGDLFAGAVAEGLRARRDLPCKTDLVVLADRAAVGPGEEGVTWLAPDAVPDGPPFAVHFGDGPSYVLIADGDGLGRARLFHSSERALAESLAFRLQHELRVPRLGG